RIRLLIGQNRDFAAAFGYACDRPAAVIRPVDVVGVDRDVARPLLRGRQGDRRGNDRHELKTYARSGGQERSAALEQTVAFSRTQRCNRWTSSAYCPRSKGNRPMSCVRYAGAPLVILASLAVS